MKVSESYSNFISEYYSKNNLFGAENPISNSRIKKLLDIIDKINCSSILDLGCGDGYFHEIISSIKPFCQIIGVDVSKKAVNIARKKKLNVVKQDLNNKMSFSNEQFDLVHAGEIIEHVTNTNLLMEEISRVLKVDGFLILSTPNLACWMNRILLLIGIQPIFLEVSYQKNFGRIFNFLGSNNIPVGHVRVFTFTAMKEMLDYYGFKIEKIYGCDVVLNSFFKYIDKFFNLFPTLSSDLIFVGRKVSKKSCI